ncbi:MAG: MBL fold metallo-hydrolase [bacterium]|nr:MBL fold metallo-hydrolase [bacterium]
MHTPIRNATITRLLAGALLAALCAASPAAAQTRYMRVYYIQWVPPGQTTSIGDCQYFEFPGPDGILGTADDRNLLVDAGGNSKVIVPFLDGKIGPGGRLWFMVLSHDHSDHQGGMRDVLNRYDVRYFYESAALPTTNIVNELIANGTGPGSDRYFALSAGDYLSGPLTNRGPGFDPAIEVRVMAARAVTDKNAGSVVQQMKFGETVFLTGGDATTTTENAILYEYAGQTYPGASQDLALTDIYKVNHHGSNSSNGQNFLNRMAAPHAIVQVGYGTATMPTAGALDRINQSGSVVYRNDLDGTVLLTCDNRGNYTITRERVYVDEATTPGGAGDLVFPPPDIPRNLRVADSGPTFVELEWDEVEGASGYDVYRSTIPGGDPGGGRPVNPGCEPTGIYERVNATPVAEPRYIDTAFTSGAAYYYRVSSKKVYSASGYSICYERRYSNEASPRGTPSPPWGSVNFKPPLPSRYTGHWPDIGSPFDPSTGYGWLLP